MGIAFDVAASSMPSSSASASIVVTPGVSISSGASSGSRELRRARDAARDLEVGGEVAVLAGDERVLARAGRREEVDRLAAAHHPRLGLRRRSTRPAALEDPVVGLLVCAEARLEPVLVAVERVRVLHDELADAEEAGARPRLVAVLRLEVVPGLRQLPVALDLAGVVGERLLVRQREHEPAARAVVEVEDLGDRVSGLSLPELDRRQARARAIPARRSRRSPRE